MICAKEKLEAIDDCELIDLLHSHWRESGEARMHDRYFYWDRDAHIDLESKNAWCAFTLRDENGNLTGYATFFLCDHPFMRSADLIPAKVAQLEALYIRPDARRGWTAIKFLREIAVYLRDDTFDAIYLGSPDGSKCGSLFKLMGGIPLETIWRIDLASQNKNKICEEGNIWECQ